MQGNKKQPQTPKSTQILSPTNELSNCQSQIHKLCPQIENCQIKENIITAEDIVISPLHKLGVVLAMRLGETNIQEYNLYTLVDGLRNCFCRTQPFMWLRILIYYVRCIIEVS